MYHIPYPDALNAGRTICNGYRNAFLDMGHEFRPLTAEENYKNEMDLFQPDILFTCLGNYFLRYTDITSLRRHKSRGMKVFVNTPFWISPINRTRINENSSLKSNRKLVALIKSDDYGDFYYNSCEQDDPRMEGFEKETGYPHITIPLAADKIALRDCFREDFSADISYVGTFLPEKRGFFRETIYPLKKEYNVRIYGQDWNTADRITGFMQKIGQYFGLPLLKTLRRPRLSFEDEGYIYASSVVSINVHEEYQRKFGGECNERTFKIPLCNGFEITDNVRCISDYFQKDEEIIVARDNEDFTDKIRYYLRRPEKRNDIIQKGRDRVLREHTYHNRVGYILGLLDS